MQRQRFCSKKFSRLWILPFSKCNTNRIYAKSVFSAWMRRKCIFRYPLVTAFCRWLKRKKNLFWLKIYVYSKNKVSSKERGRGWLSQLLYNLWLPGQLSIWVIEVGGNWYFYSEKNKPFFGKSMSYLFVYKSEKSLWLAGFSHGTTVPLGERT